jgi:hypothetical protein
MLQNLFQPLDMLNFEGNKTPRNCYILHVLCEKYFKCLGSKIINDTGCTLEITRKSKITMAKAVFKDEKNFFTRKLD